MPLQRSGWSVESTVPHHGQYLPAADCWLMHKINCSNNSVEFQKCAVLKKGKYLNKLSRK